MKNYYRRVFIVLLALAAFGACKKDYTCTCITKVTGYGLDETTTSETTIANSKKKDAESTCNAQELNFSSFGLSTTTTCTLE